MELGHSFWEQNASNAQSHYIVWILLASYFQGNIWICDTPKPKSKSANLMCWGCIPRIEVLLVKETYNCREKMGCRYFFPNNLALKFMHVKESSSSDDAPQTLTTGAIPLNCLRCWWVGHSPGGVLKAVIKRKENKRFPLWSPRWKFRALKIIILKW